MFGSSRFADTTAVGAAGLKPPPTERGAGRIVTSPGCARWSPLRSTQGYSAQPAPPFGLAYPTVPVSSCDAIRPTQARTTLLRPWSTAKVAPVAGAETFQ